MLFEYLALLLDKAVEGQISRTVELFVSSFEQFQLFGCLFVLPAIPCELLFELFDLLLGVFGVQFVLLGFDSADDVIDLLHRPKLTL